MTCPKCGCPEADHSNGLRCRCCGQECGIDCRTLAQRLAGLGEPPRCDKHLDFDAPPAVVDVAVGTALSEAEVS